MSVLGVGTASFANADAGISKGVIVSGFTLGGTDAGNYNVIQPTNVSATINKADLVLSGSKVYDGTKAVAGSTLTATGVAVRPSQLQVQEMNPICRAGTCRAAVH